MSEALLPSKHAIRIVDEYGKEHIPYDPGHNLKQLEYHSRTEPNVLYWGGRGSGKSICGRWDAHLRALAHPGFTYVILRRTYPELQRALSLDTPIPTPAGIRLMGDIQPGDTVFAPDGSPTLVTNVSVPVIDPYGTFKITFDNGETIIASAGHKWVTQTAKQRHAVWRVSSGRQASTRTDLELETITTLDIYNTLHTENGKRNNHSIEVAQPWQFTKSPLPVDPYVLGAWLGDGTRNQGAITSIDMEILDNIRIAGYEVRKRPAHIYEYGILELKNQLKQLGVVANKHVPAMYLTAGYEDRLALLQGLMDTDGCAKTDGLATFANTNKQIADSVAILAASLGLKPRRKQQLTRRRDGTLTGTTTYIVYWTSTLPVFRLTRKLERLPKQLRGVTTKHYIVSCERIEDQFCKCIAVDHPMHQYLASYSGIPTHNSHLIHVPREMRLLGGTFHHTDRVALYPNGSRGFFSHCATEEDVLNLLSAEFALAFFDELSTFEWEMFVKLSASVRVPVGSGLTAMVRAATNPLGPSAQQIMKYFVTKEVEPEEDPDYNPDDWYSIHSNLEDNKFVDQEQYRKRFSGLPEHVRKAWVEGEFVLENSLFDFYPTKTYILDGGEAVRKPYHILPDLDIDHLVRAAKIYRVYDHGYAPDPAYCAWVAHLGNRYIVFHEKTWFKTIVSDIAAEIKEIDESLGIPQIVACFCLPLDAPVWMGDFTFKPLSEVKIGDEVIGTCNKQRPLSEEENPRKGTGRRKIRFKDHLRRVKVTAIHRTRQEVLKVTMESSRVIYCTPDHRWLSGAVYKQTGQRYIIPKIGKTLVHVVDDPRVCPDPIKAAWLGGVYDGEGSRNYIAQYKDHNPDVYKQIYDYLVALGFDAKPIFNWRERYKYESGIRFNGGFEAAIKFINWIPTLRFKKWADRFLLISGYKNPDKVISIESCGIQDVGCLTTESGDFIAYGYVTSNCDPVLDVHTGMDVRTMKDLFEANGVPMECSINNREQFAAAMHQALSEEVEPGVPRLQIYHNGRQGCPYLAKAIPMQRYDPKHPLKLMNHRDDHPVVALAYFLISTSSYDRFSTKESIPKRWMKPKVDPNTKWILGADQIKEH